MEKPDQKDKELRSAYRKSTSVPLTFLPVKITETVPTITQKDVDLGTITRYFAIPANESKVSEIIEINKATFTKLKPNNFYTVVSVPWLIRGPVDIVLTETAEPIILRYGIIDANRKSTQSASKQLPGLDKVITNYARFYQGL